MGCDIHAYVEIHTPDGWKYLQKTFDCRSYGLFGFLANVRNYSEVPPISEPRGFPNDTSKKVAREYEDDLECWPAHTPSWLILEELLNFDYEAEVEDRRYTKQEAPGFFNGGATCEPGQGKKMPWKEFLGDWYFEELNKLKELGNPKDIRIVFWFDN